VHALSAGPVIDAPPAGWQRERSPIQREPSPYGAKPAAAWYDRDAAAGGGYAAGQAAASQPVGQSAPWDFEGAAHAAADVETAQIREIREHAERLQRHLAKHNVTSGPPLSVHVGGAQGEPSPYGISAEDEQSWAALYELSAKPSPVPRRAK